jgi:hypothetical protein
MQNFLKIAEGIDTTPLRLAIKRRPELWREDTYLSDYPQGPFSEVESIILRFSDRSVHATEEALREHLARFDQHESYDQPCYKLLPEARPMVMSLMARVAGERLGRVMVNKIKPGGVVFPHVDTPAHADYWDRFHIVLESQPGVIFRAGDERVYMPQDTVWWFQNAVEHEVINNSPGDRVHMVVDIRTSK